jgi:hypothetical protein
MRFVPLIELNRWRAKQAHNRTNWHRYFAWWPVNVGGNDWRWLETVERTGWYDHSKNRSSGPAPLRRKYRTLQPNVDEGDGK